jgi:hypothetical protein
MKTRIEYSKKSKRELSPFITKELLFDYEIGALDEERMLSVEQALKSSQEIRSELNKVRLGLKFFSGFVGLRPQKTLLDDAIRPNNYSYKIVKLIRFEDWPDIYRWVLEAALASLAIFLIAVVVPWHKLLSMVWNRSTQVVLSEYQKSEPVLVPTSTTVLLTQVDSTKTKEITTTETVKPLIDPKVPQGYLYRGSASVGKLELVNPLLISKLNGLGAKKAGQVDLGRLKGRSSYFHFSVEEGNLAQVKDLFESVGTFSLTKERHERVMPDGVVRIIIEVAEDPEQNEDYGVDSSDSAQSLPAEQR